MLYWADFENETYNIYIMNIRINAIPFANQSNSTHTSLRELTSTHNECADVFYERQPQPRCSEKEITEKQTGEETHTEVLGSQSDSACF